MVLQVRSQCTGQLRTDGCLHRLAHPCLRDAGCQIDARLERAPLVSSDLLQIRTEARREFLRGGVDGQAHWYVVGGVNRRARDDVRRRARQPEIFVNGVMDGLTMSALADFQQSSFQSSSGKTDAQTWAALMQSISVSHPLGTIQPLFLPRIALLGRHTSRQKDAGLYHDIWQAFAVLLPVRSVGVMGDKRTYAWPIVLRCVSSEDGMTADWSRLPYDLMETISNRIVNEVKGVNRVVLDITSKPPGTIEWE